MGDSVKNKELDLFQNLIKTIKHDWGIDYRNTFTYVKIEEALKRNEPMKVYNPHGDEMLCPSCDNEITQVYQYYRQSYCENCGQKLDWSDDNE
ncbi:MAG: hypothetical protein ACOCWM_05760 [Cyclobacteriaceae bacterium]